MVRALMAEALFTRVLLCFAELAGVDGKARLHPSCAQYAQPLTFRLPLQNPVI
jgi:hypothetical protein